MSNRTPASEEEFRASLFAPRVAEKSAAVVVAEPQVKLEPVEYLMVDDICRILGVSQSWAYKDKTLPWIKVGRLKRMHRDDFNAFMATKRNFTMKSIMRHRPLLDTTCKDEPMD